MLSGLLTSAAFERQDMKDLSISYKTLAANWKETARQRACDSDYYRGVVMKLQQAMRRAMNELGVPNEHYPAPVTNAFDFLGECLERHGIVDGFARHSDDCQREPCTCTDPDERNTPPKDDNPPEVAP